MALDHDHAMPSAKSAALANGTGVSAMRWSNPLSQSRMPAMRRSGNKVGDLAAREPLGAVAMATATSQTSATADAQAKGHR
jgi:hypothetical protein